MGITDLEKKAATSHNIADVAELARIKAFTPQQKADHYSAKVNDLISQDMSNPEKSVMFHSFSPAKVLAADEEFAASPAGLLLAPLAVKDMDIPADVIVSTMGAAYKNPEEAGATGAEFYKRSIALRNTTINYKGANFDLTNPTDFTKLIIVKKMEEITSRGYAAMRQSEGGR
jgi:hypothetical protein